MLVHILFVNSNVRNAYIYSSWSTMIVSSYDHIPLGFAMVRSESSWVHNIYQVFNFASSNVGYPAIVWAHVTDFRTDWYARVCLTVSCAHSLWMQVVRCGKFVTNACKKRWNNGCYGVRAYTYVISTQFPRVRFNARPHDCWLSRNPDRRNFTFRRFAPASLKLSWSSLRHHGVY